MVLHNDLRLALAVCLFLFCASVHAAEGLVDETAVAAQLKAFQSERTEAAKTFSAADLAAADEFAARAEASLAAKNFAAAHRFAIDARWQVPFVPPGLPEHVSRVLGYGRLRHGDRVNSVSYSPSGEQLASASRDGTVRLWNLANGRELLTYRGHENEKFTPLGAKEKEKTNVNRAPAVAFAANGKWVASAGAKEIHVWDAATGKKLHTLKAHTKDVFALAFANKDSNLLASGGDDRKVILWDVENEKSTFTSDDQVSNINAVVFSQDDKLLGSVNHTGELTIYSPKSDRKVQLSMNVAQNSANGIALLENGSGIVVGSNDSKVTLIAGPGGFQKVAEGATIHRFEGHTGPVNSVGVTPNGLLLVSGGRERGMQCGVLVWDIAARRQIRAFQGHVSPVTAIAVRPDGKQVASADEDGNIKLWPLATADDHRLHTEAGDSLWTAAYSPDGKTFTTGGADKSVRVYEAFSGKLLKTLTGHKNAVTAAAYLTADRLVTGAGDKLVKIWEMKSGESRDLTGHTSAVLAVATDDATRIVSGSADRSVRGWDATGKPSWTWTGKSAVCAVAIAKGGRRVAVGTADGMLTILDVAGSEVKLAGTVAAHQSGTLCATFSPDGARLASGGGDGAVKLWSLADAGTLNQTGKFDPPIRPTSGTATPIVTVQFSNDGRYLASGGSEMVVRVFDVASGAETRGLRGATDWVTAAAFAPDGRSIVSVGVDSKTRLFDLGRNEKSSPSGHTKPSSSVAVSRDGKLVATGSEDMTVKVWDALTGREMTTIPIQTSKAANNKIDAVSFVGNDTIVVADKEEGKLRWFDARTGKLTRTATANPGGFALSSPADGSLVAMAWVKDSGKTAGFDIFTPNGESNTLKIDKKISCAVLSPDGTWGIVGGEDGVLRVWDLAKRDRVKGDWPIMVNAIADVGLTPDRKTLVAIDVNGTVKVADAELRESTKTIENAVVGEVKCVVVSPTGKLFCTLSGTGETKVWDMNGKLQRTWKLPFTANAAVFSADGKKLITANIDGTGFVLDMP